MKKVIALASVALILTALFVLNSISSSSAKIDPNAVPIEMVSFSEYEHPEVAEQFANSIIFEESNYSGLLTEANIQNLCFNELAKIPEEIRQKFVSDGWILYVSDRKVAEEQKNIDFPIMGITVYDSKYITVKAPGIILHEFGHFYQYSGGYMDTFDEYYEEGEAAMASGSRYAAQNAHEYFATVFDIFIDYQNNRRSYIMDAIEDQIPRTWDFFKSRYESSWY